MPIGDHFNENLPCSLAVRLSHPSEAIGDICEIAIIPLTTGLLEDKSREVFNCYMKPLLGPEDLPDRFTQDIRHSDCQLVTKTQLETIQCTAISQQLGWEFFMAWFDKLNLKQDKRILPIAANFHHGIYPFLKKWVGEEIYQDYFSYLARDLKTFALALMDGQLMSGRHFTLPFHDLGNLASKLRLPYRDSKTALADAYTTLEVYRALLRFEKAV